MTDPIRTLQAQLQEALEQEAACYEAALRPVAELAEACRHGEAIDERLQQVLAPLCAFAEPESTIAALKEQWHRAGRPAGPELRAVIERLAALNRLLSRQLHQLEESVRARRDQLAAELDDGNRRFQMQRAYLRKL